MEGRELTQCPGHPRGYIFQEPSNRGWRAAWGLRAGDTQGWASLAELPLNGPQQAVVTVLS